MGTDLKQPVNIGFPPVDRDSAQTAPRRHDSVFVWMTVAFGAALGLALLVIAQFGAGERGTDIALQMTARLSFLLFWSAYCAGSLVALGWSAFDWLKRRSRALGLAFASAHLVHVGLVAWLCYIGEPPPTGSFIFFGVALFWTYVLVIFSIDAVHRSIAGGGWRILSFLGMNYILLAFAEDFMRVPFSGNAKYLIGYLPFIALSIIAPLARLAAWAHGIHRNWIARREEAAESATGRNAEVFPAK